MGSYAFMNTEKLATLHIPVSVEKIGSFCFYGCGATYLEIPDKVKVLEGEMFRGSKRLKTVKLPSSLESLTKQMFRGCDSLQNIVLPDNITEIPSYCFSGCYQLSKVSFPASLRKVLSNAFMNCSLSNVSLPEGTISVDTEAFYGCPIDTLYLPSTLETIGGWAFSLRNLKELVLPASVKKIGSYAFDDVQLEKIRNDNNTYKSQIIDEVKLYELYSEDQNENLKLYIYDTKIEELEEMEYMKIAPEALVAKKLIDCKQGDDFSINDFNYLIMKIDNYELKNEIKIDE